MKPQNNFLAQLNKKRAAAEAAEQAERSEKPIEAMSAGELRYVALEKPTDEMSLQELRWVSSGAAERTLEEQAPKHKLHNFNDLKRNRRRGWK